MPITAVTLISDDYMMIAGIAKVNENGAPFMSMPSGSHTNTSVQQRKARDIFKNTTFHRNCNPPSTEIAHHLIEQQEVDMDICTTNDEDVLSAALPVVKNIEVRSEEQVSDQEQEKNDDVAMVVIVEQQIHAEVILRATGVPPPLVKNKDEQQENRRADIMSPPRRTNTTPHSTSSTMNTDFMVLARTLATTWKEEQENGPQDDAGREKKDVMLEMGNGGNSGDSMSDTIFDSLFPGAHVMKNDNNYNNTKNKKQISNGGDDSLLLGKNAAPAGRGFLSTLKTDIWSAFSPR
jgi:hypothetical protein